ncbi:spore germination protein [Oceanobacillus arenosus]|uniref:Spore germination protein n=1 Tax=Oceanobacillus arenosus TaxID=1229153 RepID=A0A3D8PVQ4_9BACI|nr:spore germination protein [Oceanobacillus arenosus]RDW20173.1 spore germination protein [Oceanobacillus arenosus]
MARTSFFNRRKMKTSKSKQENQIKTTIELGTNLADNLKNIRTLLGEPGDLIIRETTLGETDTKCAIVYLSGLVDQDLVNNNILKVIQSNINEIDTNRINEVFQQIIAITDIKKGTKFDDVINSLLSGSTLFYLDDMDTVLILGTTGGERRSIEEPQSEALIRGPREGFVESVHTNIALLRRDIKNPNLRFKSYEVGKKSKRTIVVSYLEGIINPTLLKEVNRRLKSINLDIVSESGFLEQWIEDSFLSPFPQMINTERPDRVSSSLLQGKVAILVDGTPFALIAPITYSETLKSLEDYYERWLVGTLIRILRYLGTFIALFLPAIYIALVSYHQGMIPTELAFSIALTREGVPFPSFVEALLMIITMEILQEAGARLPKNLGQTIGIVGGLVIGEAAVSASIVSPVMVIVVGLTAISSFTNPSYSAGIGFRMLRLTFMIAAAILGLYGIILAYIMLNIHIANLKSFGVPYSAPFAPTYFSDWKDTIIRVPITMLEKQPKYMKIEDSKAKSNEEEQK